MKVPPLLDEKTIIAIHERIRTNITYTRGNRKNPYLLAGTVFCKRCGYSLRSFTNHSGVQYYRHSKYGKCNHPSKMVPATELENSILINLIKTFGDPELIQKVIEKATPDLSKVEDLTKEKNSLSNELKKIASQKNKIIDSVADGLLSKVEIKTNMDKLREREANINSRISIIESELNNIPNPEHVKNASKLAGKIVTHATKNNPGLIFKRSFEWKRKLIENAFSGVNHAGQRFGIYVDYVKKQFTFEIRGIFENTVSFLPLPDETLIDVFNLDPEYTDETNLQQLRENIKSNSLSECHAYFSKCIHKR
jgi:hypothetical protein